MCLFEHVPAARERGEQRTGSLQADLNTRLIGGQVKDLACLGLGQVEQRKVWAGKLGFILLSSSSQW
jgi:hypothetical protein